MPVGHRLNRLGPAIACDAASGGSGTGAVGLDAGCSIKVRSVPDVEIAGLDQPALVGEDNDLGAVTEAELGEDA